MLCPGDPSKWTNDNYLFALKYWNALYLSASSWSHQMIQITMNLLKLRTRTSDFDVLSESKCNGLCFENCGSIEEQTITQPLLALKGCAHCKFFYLPQNQNKARVRSCFWNLRNVKNFFSFLKCQKMCPRKGQVSPPPAVSSPLRDSETTAQPSQPSDQQVSVTVVRNLKSEVWVKTNNFWWLLLWSAKKY